MAIRFITGVPGGGKTYYAVKHLVETYFDYNAERQEYILKPDHQGLTIFTNIDRLDLDHINLKEALRKDRVDIKKFFTVPYQERILKKYPRLVYIIDEAQQFFGRRFRDEGVFYFFEYHRHLGIDIYLITQNRRKIAQDITDLIEIEYRAVKRSLSITGELKYLVLSENQIIDRKMIRPKKRIYSLYRSMTAKETEKLKNPLKKYFVALLIIMALSVYGFKRTFLGKPSHAKEENKQANIQPPKASKHFKPEPSIKPIEEDLKALSASYCIIGSDIYIFDPVSKTILPAEEFPHKVRIRRFKRKLYITVFVPPDQLPQEKPQQSCEAPEQPGPSQEL